MFDWFWEFLYRLLKTILYCIDFIMQFAKQLMGIEPVRDAENNEVELLNFFLTSEAILDAFKMVAMVGVVLLFLFTAFAVARAIGKLGEGKSPLRVCMDAAKSLLYFLLIPAIMIIGCSFVSTIMKSIYFATSGNSVSLGNELFTLFADEAYTGAYDLFGNNHTPGGGKEGLMDLFRGSGPFSSTSSDGFNYYKMGNVSNYFDLEEINYFLGFVAGFCVLVLLVKPLLSFVERIISLVLLFVVAPISVASSVLDDGARFKLWRDQVINKFLVAYGSLISLNIFVLLVGVIYDVTFFDSSFLNGLARLAFVLGGALSCRMGAVLIGNLVNSGAGSQYAQDMHNVSSPLSTLAHAGVASGIMGGMANRVSGVLSRKLSPKIHRSSNAKNEVKNKMAQKKYAQKLEARKAGRNTVKSSMATGSPAGAAWSKGTVGAGAGGMPPRDIKDVMIGRRGGGAPAGASPSAKGSDSAMNKQSAATVKDAMKAGKDAGVGIKP